LSKTFKLFKRFKSGFLDARAVQKKHFIEGCGMEERIVRLRIHQKKTDRYQSLLTTKLSEDEKHYLEKRLSEERFAITMLQFMSRQAGSDLPSAVK